MASLQKLVSVVVSRAVYGSGLNAHKMTKFGVPEGTMRRALRGSNISLVTLEAILAIAGYRVTAIEVTSADGQPKTIRVEPQQQKKVS